MDRGSADGDEDLRAVKVENGVYRPIVARGVDVRRIGRENVGSNGLRAVKTLSMGRGRNRRMVVVGCRNLSVADVIRSSMHQFAVLPTLVHNQLFRFMLSRFATFFYRLHALR